MNNLLFGISKGNFIDNKWLDVRTDGAYPTFVSSSPSNPDVMIGTFPDSGRNEVYSAVLAATKAFPSWSHLSKIKRAEYLDHFAQLVKENAEEIAKIMALESGKPIVECRADIIEGLHTAQYWFGKARMNSGEIIASEITEKESYVYRKPKGVVAAISPWNFPFAIPLWLICPSLMEGNTVVFKPSEETPMVAQILVDLFSQVNLPPGVLNLVQGHGDTGWELVTHPNVNVVLFTGSYEVGQKIRTESSRHSNKFFAGEMGGKNAMIICDDADIDLAVNAAILSAFKTSGQRCVSASRIFVHDSLFDEFSYKFVEKAKHLAIGNASNEDTFMGPLINQEALDKVIFYNDLAKKEGAKVLLDWTIPHLPSDCEDGFFITPFIYAVQPENRYALWDKRVLQEEVFGPHVALIPFETLDDAVNYHNDCPYGFALSIFSNDYRTIKYLRENCEFGVGYVNLPTIGAEVQLVFGGLKRSGSGSPSAAALNEAVTHRLSFTVNYGHEIKLAQGLK